MSFIYEMYHFDYKILLKFAKLYKVNYEEKTSD